MLMNTSGLAWNEVVSRNGNVRVFLRWLRLISKLGVAGGGGAARGSDLRSGNELAWIRWADECQGRMVR